ncbi:hypothetical protein MHYP_G00259560 [Metynnis hypsauchen]
MEEIGQNISWSGSVAYECPVRSHFGFQLMCVITCRGCGSQKSRQEDLNHLAVALVPQGSVTDCIKLFFSDETEIECKCEVCGCNSASCRWAFHTLPSNPVESTGHTPKKRATHLFHLPRDTPPKGHYVSDCSSQSDSCLSDGGAGCPAKAV